MGARYMPSYHRIILNIHRMRVWKIRESSLCHFEKFNGYHYSLHAHKIRENNNE